jgi:hypothetical protein
MEQKRVLAVNSILGRRPRRNLPLDGALRVARLAGDYGHRWCQEMVAGELTTDRRMEQKRVLAVNSTLGRRPRRNLPLDGALRVARLAGGYVRTKDVWTMLLAGRRWLVAWSRSVYWR